MAGVAILGTSERVTVSRNEIYGKHGVSIDLGGEGYTPNDLTDADAGPNGLLNFLLLRLGSGAKDGSVRAAGTAGSGQTIELLRADSTVGHGPALAYLDSAVADAAGEFTKKGMVHDRLVVLMNFASNISREALL